MIRLSRHDGDGPSDWAIQFDAKGRIQSIGREIGAFLSMDGASQIWDLPLMGEDLRRLRRHLSSGTSDSLVLILPSTDGASSRVAEVVCTGADHFVLKLVGLSLAPEAQQVFEESFGVSQAQFRVLECLVTGASIKAIAEQLDRSVETVRSHVKALSRRLGARSQPELVSRALSVPVRERDRLSQPSDRTDSHVLDVGGVRIEYLSSGDPAGRPVLYFQHATDGPYVSEALHRALGRSGLRLISIARPGAGGTDRKALAGREFVDVTSRFHNKVADSLGLSTTTLLSAGTGLPHALAYAERFAPEATILALNPFPPFLSKDDCEKLPGRWRTYALVASRKPFIVQALILIAWQLFKRDPDRHVARMLKEDIPAAIDPELRDDLINTLRKNMTLNAKRQARHYAEEARLLSRDWAAPARLLTPRLRIQLVQGTGHFSIPQDMLDRLALALPNATAETRNGPVDPIHHLDPDWLAERLLHLTQGARL